jgi:hypothetical protein
LTINSSGPRERSICLFDFGDFEDRLVAFAEIRTIFLEARLLESTLRAGLETLRADRALRAADFFAELFFFFSLAIT